MENSLQVTERDFAKAAGVEPARVHFEDATRSENQRTVENVASSRRDKCSTGLADSQIQSVLPALKVGATGLEPVTPTV